MTLEAPLPIQHPSENPVAWPGGLQVLLDTSLDAVVVMDAAGCVADWNDQAADIFGWTRDEAVGSLMSDMVIPPEHRAAHARGLAHFLASGEGPLLRRRIEVLALRRSGEEFPVELTISPVRAPDGWLFVGSLRDISERKRNEEHQRLLLAEINHRAKNTLAVVTGIASQTARSSRSVAAFNETFMARLAALGRAHTLLTDRNWSSTPLQRLVEELLGPHAQPQDGQLQIAGDAVSLRPKPALAMSMILHELVTNAAKYGALATPEGRIFVEWSVSPESGLIHFTWREAGVVGMTAPKRTGFGTRMIAASTQHELDGVVSVTYEAGGIRYEFEFPVAQ